MKLKDGIVCEKIGGEFVAVATGELSRSFHGLIRGNATMSYILSLLSNDMTEDELCTAMLEKYDISEDIARRDIRILTEKLSAAGLLE